MRLKPLLVVLAVLFLGTGVTGCMNHNEYADKILSELKEKYHTDFQITDLYYEMSGEDGSCYRAVCKDGEDTFAARYYLKGTDYLLRDRLEEDLKPDEGEPYLTDTYSALLLNRQLEKELKALDPSILFAISEVETFGRDLTPDDARRGAECLSDPELKLQSEVYIFIDKNTADRAQAEDKILSDILSFGAYSQGVDFAYIGEPDSDAVRSDYHGDTYRIEARLKEDSRIARYLWYHAERDKGVTDSRVVKEG